MLGMAGPAFRLRIDLHHPAMHGGRIDHFCGNIYMTGQTTVIHAIGFPGSGVTGFAISRNVSMRGDAAKHIAGCCIQSAWAIHGPTTCEGRGSDDQSCDKCCKHSCTRKAPQAIRLHLPPYLDKVSVLHEKRENSRK
jgi:hypothetical protein